MSNDIINLVYRKVLGSPVRKSILVYLADRASDDGSAIWASKSTIAAATDCGVSTVIRTMGNFVSEGILIEVGHSPCQGGATIVYAMDLKRVASLPDAKPGKGKTPPAAGPLPERDPSRSGTPPLPERDPHPSRSGTQTILEPSLNLSLTRESPNDDIQSAFAAWNDLAERAGLPKAQKMTESRKAKMRARLRDAGGLAGWRHALDLVEGSAFLTGQAPCSNGKPFTASLDFVLSEEKFTKIMEKQYAERSNRNGADGRGRMAHVEQSERRGQRATFAGQITRDRLQNGQ